MNNFVVCGTGHRPDKLGGYGKDVFERLTRLAVDWIETQPETPLIISGGALGWDQALANAALRATVPYAMYLPFEGFDCKWPMESRRLLSRLCEGSSEVLYIEPPGYAAWKMQSRNKAMVNASHKVVALWNGTDGGTANCVAYAQKVGRPIINLWDLWKEKDDE